MYVIAILLGGKLALKIEVINQFLTVNAFKFASGIVKSLVLTISGFIIKFVGFSHLLKQKNTI